MAEIKTKSNEEVHRQADESIKPTYKEFVDKKLVNQMPVDEKDLLEDGISSLNERLTENQAETTKNDTPELLNILKNDNKQAADSNEKLKDLEIRFFVKLEENKRNIEVIQL